MTIAVDHFGAFEDDDDAVVSATPTFWHGRADAPLAAILARKDDRLIDDVGLTREELIGEAAGHQRIWAAKRTLWQL